MRLAVQTIGATGRSLSIRDVASVSRHSFLIDVVALKIIGGVLISVSSWTEHQSLRSWSPKPRFTI